MPSILSDLQTDHLVDYLLSILSFIRAEYPTRNNWRDGILIKFFVFI